jgi:hypothetical protein
MKKAKFLIAALVLSCTVAFVSTQKASANKKFPLCKAAPEEVCSTGPGGTELIWDARNR